MLQLEIINFPAIPESTHPSMQGKRDIDSIELQRLKNCLSVSNACLEYRASFCICWPVLSTAADGTIDNTLRAFARAKKFAWHASRATMKQKFRLPFGFCRGVAPLEYIRQNCIKKFSTGTDILFCLFPRFLCPRRRPPSSLCLPSPSSSLRREDSNGLSLQRTVGQLQRKTTCSLQRRDFFLPSRPAFQSQSSTTTRGEQQPWWRDVTRQLNFNAMMRNLFGVLGWISVCP